MDEVEEADRIPDGSQMSGMLRKKRVQNFRPHGRAYDVLALSYRGALRPDKDSARPAD